MDRKADSSFLRRHLTGMRHQDATVVSWALWAAWGFVALSAVWNSGLRRWGPNASTGRHSPGEPYRVHLNSCDWPEFCLLPGISRTLAQRIVDDRSRRGPFDGVDELTRVRGIGPKTLADVRSRLSAETTRRRHRKISPDAPR